MDDHQWRAVFVWGTLALAAAVLFALRAKSGWNGATAIDDELRWLLLINATLPRVATAVLTGATLALSGLILQRVLRNALAEPSTLGIFSGAQVAMALAALYAPWLLHGGREAVAFAGGMAAMLLILSLTWRRGLEPVSLILAGMMVSLAASSLSAALVLANGEYLYTLFIWGGGSLVQHGWGPAVTLLVLMTIAAAAVVALQRPLAILGLDDSGARSLGLTPTLWRALAIALAVGLATTVAAEVGVIGFIGLAAPALAELSGARRFTDKLIAAPIIGAIVLWLTDELVQLTATGSVEWMPTGAATAFLGGPLLLWMLLRLRIYEWRSLTDRAVTPRRIARPALAVMLIAAGSLVAAGVSLVVGRGPEGWHIAQGALLAELAEWRLPRIVIAASAGAMLGTAGLIMQRMTSNPLASPEMLGVSSGAGIGLAAMLALFPMAGLATQFAGLATGALGAIALIMTVAASRRIGPERLLLAGIAVAAMGNAVVTAVVATGDQLSFALLRWLSGTTHAASPDEARIAALAAIVLVAPTAFAIRWLTALPLGSAVSQGIGIAVRRARLLLIVLAGLLSAAAALFIGPLSFVGLIAPHVARMIGLATTSAQLTGSAMIGGGLLIVADWMSRWIAFPYELPLSLLASMIAGPYLIYLLSRGTSRNAS